MIFFLAYFTPVPANCIYPPLFSDTYGPTEHTRGIILNTRTPQPSYGISCIRGEGSSHTGTHLQRYPPAPAHTTPSGLRVSRIMIHSTIGITSIIPTSSSCQISGTIAQLQHLRLHYLDQYYTRAHHCTTKYKTHISRKQESLQGRALLRLYLYLYESKYPPLPYGTSKEARSSTNQAFFDYVTQVKFQVTNFKVSRPGWLPIT